MAKIEIIQQLEDEFRLDICQVQIIGLYNSLILDENILNFLRFLNRNGYMVYIGKKNGRPYFEGFDKERLALMRDRWWYGQSEGVPLEESIFQTYIVGYCKKILTAWHGGKPFRITWI